jgi:serine/threonine protein kinase
MPTEKCPERQALEQFVQGQIAEEDARAIESHLLECPSCVQSAAMVATVVVGSSALASDSTGPHPQSLDELQAKLKAIWQQTGTVIGPADSSTSSSPESEVFLCRQILQPPEPGSTDLGRLGPYAVRRIVGAGGMGLVFVAWDAALKREVAIKVLKPALAADYESRERFLREAQAAAALRNDYVIEIYQVGEDRGIPFLVMPLLAGETLERRIASSGSLSMAQVLRIGREIALGLAAAHAKRLIHRDIKPGNIWLEKETDRVKILDFGLARDLIADVKLTNSDTILGSAAYMSPEQADPGRRAVDERTDLFSLGCVIYEMATGVSPFHRPGLIRTLKAVLEEQPQAPDQLNHSLTPVFSEFVLKLLAKDPQDRPASAMAVFRALDTPQSVFEIETGQEIAQPQSVVGTDVGDQRPPRRNGPFALVATAIFFAAFSYLYGAQVFRILTNQGIVVITVNDPQIEVTVKDTSIIVRDGSAQREFTLAAGDYIFHVTAKDPAGKLNFDADKLTLIRGGTIVFNAHQEIERHKAGTKSVAAISPPTEAPPSTAPIAGGDRPAAEWVLATGGVVTLVVDGAERAAHAGEKLPGGDWRLVKVDLNEKKVTGEGLKILERVPQLRELHLAQTDADDSWLTTILKLVHLKELDVGATKISEAGVQRLARLTELRVLSAWGLNLTDAGLKPLNALKGLEVVNFGGTHVTGTGFAELKDLKKLFYIEMIDAPIDDTSVQGIHDLPNNCTLVLILDRTKLTDEGLSRLRGRSIWNLHLNGLPITDKGIANLGISEVRYLTHLQLRGTEVTDAAVASLLQVRALNGIDLRETNVSARGFAALKKVFPQATIEWSEPNRTAAETIFKVGGTVSVQAGLEASERFVKRAADLPLDPLAVTGVNLAGTKSSLADVWPAVANRRLKRLASLDLSDRAVTTGDLERVKTLVHLRRLSFDRSQINALDLVLLEGLPELTELRLDCPTLDSLPIAAGSFPRLERLSLATSGLTDDSVSDLSRLDSLKELDLRGTKLSPAGIAALKKALPHCHILDAGGKL